MQLPCCSSGRGLSFDTSVGVVHGGVTRTVMVKVKPRKPGKVKATFKVTCDKAGGKPVEKKIMVRKNGLRRLGRGST